MAWGILESYRFGRPGDGRRRVTFVLHRPEHRNSTNVPNHFRVMDHKIHRRTGNLIPRFLQTGNVHDARTAEDATVPCTKACRSHRPRQACSTRNCNDVKRERVRCVGACRFRGTGRHKHRIGSQPEERTNSDSFLSGKGGSH